jgi:hypothetical protein
VQFNKAIAPNQKSTTSDRPFITTTQCDRPQPKINNQRSPLLLPTKKRSPLTKNQKTAIALSSPYNKAIAPNQNQQPSISP